MLLNNLFDISLHVSFNRGMDAKQFIAQCGGATELARVLGLPKKSGAQTVHNWKKRGIPSAVILANPSVFHEFIKSKKAV